MTDPMFRCADCGVELTLHRGTWVEEVGPGQYSTLCRSHLSRQPDGSARVEAAHFHYVAGETQRVFEPKEKDHG